MSEAVILCEGFYDRAFWAGWLEYSGCPKPEPGNIHDTLKRPVKGGQFGYYTPNGQFIRIVPCHGKDNVLPVLRRRIEDRQQAPLLSQLVVNVDPDTRVADSDGRTGLRTEDVERDVKQLVPNAARNDDGDIVIDDGATMVSLVRWETGDSETEGIPAQQCLERLVCAALVAAYPERGQPIQNWLEGRPRAPDLTPKEFAWSHMAGWYAQRGCNDFYRALWSDPKVVSELESRLKASGAGRIAEALLGTNQVGR
ncbi:MAG: hypothetical protein KAY37_03980 [Phycisphaerae bacterium]|nr:hypothetical protein [Phycisphaerae bacterium]